MDNKNSPSAENYISLGGGKINDQYVDAANLVNAASEVWIKNLIDHSRSNPLLFYRDLKVGTLDLTNTPVALQRLLEGKRLEVKDLLPPVGEQLTLEDEVSPQKEYYYQEEAKKKVQHSLLAIQRKASSNLEEKGIETLFLALGMATWSAADGGRPYLAPVLLLPMQIHIRSRIGEDIKLEFSGDPQVNIVLIYILEEYYKIKVNSEELLKAASKEDDEGNILIEPENAYHYLKQKSHSIRDFNVERRAALGNFQFAKMAMVEDMRRHGYQLATHPLIAAIAGHPSSRQELSSGVENIDIRALDGKRPEDDHLVLDADSSQHKAIYLSCQGQNGVIQGPPGTGKSQTIANLIAEMAARGKRILFVAEKRAALEAVLKRLEQCGLGHLTLDLHGASISKKAVMAKIADTLTKIQNSLPVYSESIFREFEETRSKLNEHAERINSPRKPTGYSVQKIEGLLLRLPKEASTNARLRGPILLKLIPTEAQKIRQWISEAASQHLLFLGTAISPWNNAKIYAGGSAQHANDEAKRIASTLWPSFETALSETIKGLGINIPSSLNQCQKLVTLLHDINSLLEHYSAEIFKIEPGAKAKQLEHASKGIFATTWAFIFNTPFRLARLELLKMRKVPAQTFVLQREACFAQEILDRWYRVKPELPPQGSIDNIIELEQALKELLKSLDPLLDIIEHNDLRRLPLPEVASHLNALASDNRTPYKMPAIFTLRENIRLAGLEPFINELKENKKSPELWVDCFDYTWLYSSLEEALAEDEKLASFNGRLHEKYVEEFIRLDEERLRLNADRVSRLQGEFAIQTMNKYPEQKDLIFREANKRTRHKPLRQLLATAPDVLTRIAPCWIASPLSVSQLLDGNSRHFDLVLFDEASQILTEEAVPSLLRAEQAVVAGDRHQLPPTTFFTTSIEEDEAEEEKQATLEAISGFESLLDILATFLPNWMLEWHYRSQDERLIAFSNHHIYHDRLITFPSAEAQETIMHRHISGIFGRSGQEESSSQEIQEVISLIMKHAREKPDESLGVITMGIKHANRIQATLDRELSYEAHNSDFFMLDKKEPFFIKNLETVQGDERDAIILSIGYGKNSEGDLPHRFGPLTQDTGHRRLNVAITRARRRITVVSSFSHHEIDLRRSGSKGVELLKLYLEYVAGGGKRLPSSAQIGEVPLNPFEADIKDALEASGIPLLTQYGVSRYRIDLVALHPEKPGRPVLAIECDGASYHSSATARDRDRIRQQHLMRLGWSFHRIWSTDWFNNREEEIQRAISAFKEAVRYAELKDAQEGNESEIQLAKEEKKQTLGNSDIPKRNSLPQILHKKNIHEYSRFELRALAEWAMSDGLLRTDEELMRDMCKALGFKKLGSNIRRAFKRALLDVKMQEQGRFKR